jgi:chemotaxis protein methyltransferase CheR
MAALANSGVRHLGELQHRILTEPEFFQTMLHHLTVQVSELFRDPDFYLAFRKRVVPILKTYPQIKIWHAGCASGEEAYTTAIILLEERVLDRTQLYATDIDATAIARAQEAMYPESDVASFEENYFLAGGTGKLADHCTRAYGGIALRSALRENIVFFEHDLVSDYALGEMQVIFCRNVLIYFGAELRARVTQLFSESLCRGGFLCLGSSEHFPSRPGDLQQFAAAERIYRKGDA